MTLFLISWFLSGLIVNFLGIFIDYKVNHVKKRDYLRFDVLMYFLFIISGYIAVLIFIVWILMEVLDYRKIKNWLYQPLFKEKT